MIVIWLQKIRTVELDSKTIKLQIVRSFLILFLNLFLDFILKFKHEMLLNNECRNMYHPNS